MLKDGKEVDDSVADDSVTDDSTEKMVDGVPASVAAAIDAVNEDHADDDDDQYKDTDDDNGKVNKDSAEADDDDTEVGVDDDTVVTNENDDDEVEADGDVEVEGIEVLGYSAEMVQKLNDVDPNIVKDIKALLDTTNVKESSEEDSVVVPKKAEKVETEGLISAEDMAVLEKENPAVANSIKSLSATVEKLSSSLNTVAEADEVRAQTAKDKECYDNFCDTNSRLDKMAKDHPIFGEYDKLPLNDAGVPDERNRCVKARAKVFGQAQALYSTGSFGTFKECLDGAVTLYEGENGEKTAMRKVAKELRGRERQITNRPNRNKHKKQEPKPGTDAFMEDVVGKAFKEAGVKA
jgi:hypothetical protein